MRLPGMSGRMAPPTAGQRSGRMPVPPEVQLVGSVALGKYKLARFIGEGSNSRVFLAFPADDPGSPVVVKVVKEHLLENPRFRQFFDGEVLSMARFRHPYAVRLLDARFDDPLGPCLALEYIPGITLEDLLARHRRLPPERVARLLGPLCHALQAAHDAGIVHRDLKPANVMVVNADTPDESVKVMDFGFAGFASKPHIQLAELTGRGSVYACGTPAYVSPEMVRGDAVDARADLYSVAVMLFEMLAGRLPFDAETQEDLLAAHVQDQPPRFHRIGCSDVPPAVEGVVQIALSKYPNERQPTARALADAFGRAIRPRFDLWAETAPAGPPAADDLGDLVECVVAPPGSTDASPLDPYILSDRFEALLPEKLAVVKIRGFIEDVGGQAVASEPGLIRVRLDLPKGWADETAGRPKGSALFGWLGANRAAVVPKGREPIEMDLQMEKLDPNRVAVLVAFRPLEAHVPDSVRQWKDRCEGVYTTLRRYLMAE